MVFVVILYWSKFFRLYDHENVTLYFYIIQGLWSVKKNMGISKYLRHRLHQIWNVGFYDNPVLLMDCTWIWDKLLNFYTQDIW